MNERRVSVTAAIIGGGGATCQAWDAAVDRAGVLQGMLLDRRPRLTLLRPRI
jgi:hypothetical protein